MKPPGPANPFFSDGIQLTVCYGLQKESLLILIERSKTMREDVQAALDTVRPQLQADGGDCELVDVTDDGTVKVRLTGACGGCPMSQMTLKMGIERVLKERVPSVKAVEAV
jgi:Fe-S cluster biogenesis protein NfuA